MFFVLGGDCVLFRFSVKREINTVVSGFEALRHFRFLIGKLLRDSLYCIDISGSGIISGIDCGFVCSGGDCFLACRDCGLNSSPILGGIICFALTLGVSFERGFLSSLVSFERVRNSFNRVDCGFRFGERNVHRGYVGGFIDCRLACRDCALNSSPILGSIICFALTLGISFKRGKRFGFLVRERVGGFLLCRLYFIYLGFRCGERGVHRGYVGGIVDCFLAGGNGELNGSPIVGSVAVLAFCKGVLVGLVFLVLFIDGDGIVYDFACFDFAHGAVVFDFAGGDFAVDDSALVDDDLGARSVHGRNGAGFNRDLGAVGLCADFDVLGVLVNVYGNVARNGNGGRSFDVHFVFGLIVDEHAVRSGRNYDFGRSLDVLVLYGNHDSALLDGHCGLCRMSAGAEHDTVENERVVGGGYNEVVGGVAVLELHVGVPGDGGVDRVDFHAVGLHLFARLYGGLAVAQIHFAGFRRSQGHFADYAQVVPVHLQVEQLVRVEVAVHDNVVVQHYRLVYVVVDCRFKLLGGGNVGRALGKACVYNAHAGNNAGGYQHYAYRDCHQKLLQSFSHGM